MPSKSESWIENNNCSEKVNSVRISELPELKIKEEDQSLEKCEEDENDDEEEDDEDDEENENFQDSSYPMDLPLEVITTIEPFNYSYPHLKNMSNGVLTHRNIFTEQEREVLRRIVDKYREIVDTRSRTREIYLEKQNVWQQIVEEYNSTENILVRTEKELKKCWDNMKYRARLAEKEQQKAENILNNRKSPDPHQIAFNAVQAALEKMSSIQAQTCHDNSNELNGVSKCDNAINFDTHDSWSCMEKNSLSESGEPEKSLKNSDYDSLDDDDDDDVQPLLKKARQESPKLSSILLGDTKKSSYLKLDNSASKSKYSIPNCTKVSQDEEEN
ncbi:Myb/SANT-like DNA-binding domain-containing protein 3 [Armadillidium vulgare]|nr:Myb/SANT-like DNA-binding domain-containing protein 3 [Armadillidium vulgare]